MSDENKGLIGLGLLVAGFLWINYKGQAVRRVGPGASRSVARGYSQSITEPVPGMQTGDPFLQGIPGTLLQPGDFLPSSDFNPIIGNIPTPNQSGTSVNLLTPSPGFNSRGSEYYII